MEINGKGFCSIKAYSFEDEYGDDVNEYLLFLAINENDKGRSIRLDGGN